MTSEKAGTDVDVYQWQRRFTDSWYPPDLYVTVFCYLISQQTCNVMIVLMLQIRECGDRKLNLSKFHIAQKGQSHDFNLGLLLCLLFLSTSSFFSWTMISIESKIKTGIAKPRYAGDERTMIMKQIKNTHSYKDATRISVGTTRRAKCYRQCRWHKSPISGINHLRLLLRPEKQMGASVSGWVPRSALCCAPWPWTPQI